MTIEHFLIAADAIGPQSWMQWRRTASGFAPSVGKSYDVSSGKAKKELLQTVQVAWTNDSPVSQWVYGWVSLGGRRVTLQARSRGYIASSHGALITDTYDPDAPPSVPVAQVSATGGGTSLGLGGMLDTGGAYAISERRQNSRSMYLMPQLTGWFLVEPGKTFNGRVETRFISTYWESTQIVGGDQDTDSSIESGDLTLDLFAIPAMTALTPRGVPTIVAAAHNTAVTTHTVVPVPAGVEAGDVLLAVVAADTGAFGVIAAEQDGWTLAHGRDAGNLDSHLKVYIRTAGGSEPAHYTFANSLAAEETGVIVALRGAEPYDPTYPLWYFASTIAHNRSALVHTSPSIDATGQLLLTISYFSHAFPGGPAHQDPPDGMTEVLDIANTLTSLEVASIGSPPRPSGERVSGPTGAVATIGHSINVSILVPGTRS